MRVIRVFSVVCWATLVVSSAPQFDVSEENSPILAACFNQSVSQVIPDTEYKKHYRFDKREAPWFVGQWMCEYHGMQLVSVRNITDLETLVSVIADEGFVGEPLWIEHRIPKNGEEWNHKEPNHLGKEYCTQITMKGSCLWEELTNCNDNRAYVCETRDDEDGPEYQLNSSYDENKDHTWSKESLGQVVRRIWPWATNYRAV